MAVCLFLNCSKLAQVTDSKLSDNNNCGKRPILEPLSLIIDNLKKILGVEYKLGQEIKILAVHTASILREKR